MSLTSTTSLQEASCRQHPPPIPTLPRYYDASLKWW